MDAVSSHPYIMMRAILIQRLKLAAVMKLITEHGVLGEPVRRWCTPGLCAREIYTVHKSGRA